MKKLILIVAMLLVSACATGPRNMKEMHPILPARDGDPRVGLIILEGEPVVNIEFFDQAGRRVMMWDEAGKNPLEPKYNGHRRPRLYAVALEPGHYRVEVRPFYYTANLFLARRLVELPTRTSSINIDRKVDTYDGRYTGQHWGWVLRINAGDIPRGHYSGPQMNITGTGLPGLVLDWIIGGRR